MVNFRAALIVITIKGPPHSNKDRIVISEKRGKVFPLSLNQSWYTKLETHAVDKHINQMLIRESILTVSDLRTYK